VNKFLSDLRVETIKAWKRNRADRKAARNKIRSGK
jgi:hypothetical protein